MVDVKRLQKTIQRDAPLKAGRAWRWSAQNAFLLKQDIESGVQWRDRHGLVQDQKGKFVKKGNVESYLNYPKLRRTGRLFKGLKVRVDNGGGKTKIVLYNNVDYASEHQLGSPTERKKITQRYLKGGAKYVYTGGKVEQRRFMGVDTKILKAPQRIVEAEMKRLGWKRI